MIIKHIRLFNIRGTEIMAELFDSLIQIKHMKKSVNNVFLTSQDLVQIRTYILTITLQYNVQKLPLLLKCFNFLQ